MYEFIDEHRQSHSVKTLCRVLAVSRSSYYAWRSRPPSPRQQANQYLLKRIQSIFANSRQTYGSPRIHAELRAQGIHCNHKRVERLMRQNSIRVTLRRRYKITTRSNPNITAAPNRLQRDFAIAAPNRKWASDFTYISTHEGWLYLAVVLDIGSRRIVGWAMDKTMNQNLTYRALQMALQQRQPQGIHLIHHSDQGVQYTASRYLDLLRQHQITISMSRRANCYDNAVVESFFATLKTELIHRTSFLTRQEAYPDIFDYIEVFYNRQRRHSALHYLSPLDYEATFAD